MYRVIERPINFPGRLNYLSSDFSIWNFAPLRSEINLDLIAIKSEALALRRLVYFYTIQHSGFPS